MYIAKNVCFQVCRKSDNDLLLISEVTGISDRKVIEHAITRCCDQKGLYRVNDVINHLLGDDVEIGSSPSSVSISRQRISIKQYSRIESLMLVSSMKKHGICGAAYKLSTVSRWPSLTCQVRIPRWLLVIKGPVSLWKAKCG